MSLNRTVKRKLESGEYKMSASGMYYLISDKRGKIKHTILKSQVIEQKVNEDMMEKQIVTVTDVPVHTYFEDLVLQSRLNCV